MLPSDAAPLRLLHLFVQLLPSKVRLLLLLLVLLLMMLLVPLQSHLPPRKKA